MYLFFCVNITDSCVFVEEQGMGPDNEAVHDLMRTSGACLPFPTNATGVLHSGSGDGSLRVDHWEKPARPSPLRLEALPVLPGGGRIETLEG